MAGKGLEGVVVGQSRLSDIDGEVGELIYAGYDIDDLARNTTFEEVCYLLWNGELPNREQLDGFKAELAAQAKLDDRMLAILRTFPHDPDPMAALRTAVSALGMFDPAADEITPDEVRSVRNDAIVAVRFRLAAWIDLIAPQSMRVWLSDALTV
jgi:citrate synthase